MAVEMPTLAEIEAVTAVLKRLDGYGVSPRLVACVVLGVAYEARLELAELESLVEEEGRP